MPTTVELAGQRVTDDYWWLRDKSNPNVLRYLNAENAYTRAMTASSKPVEDALFAEMVGRIQETDESAPAAKAGWYYSVRQEKGKQFPIYLRRAGAADAPATIVEDVNALAVGHEFFAYNSGVVSDDGNLLAFSTDVTGNRQNVLQVKDLRNGRMLPDRIEQVEGFAWAADNHTLFYVEQDSAKRAARLMRHELGSPVKRDEVVYAEKDEEFFLTVQRSRSGGFVFVKSMAIASSETRAIPADKPAAVPRLIRRRQPGVEYDVEHRGDRFFIRINDTGPNFRLVTAPVTNPSAAQGWRELVPEREGVVLSGFDVFARHLILGERRDGLSGFSYAAIGNPGDPLPETPAFTALSFPEPDYAVTPDENLEFDARTFRFKYSSLVTPVSVFSLDLENGRQTLLKRTEVRGFNPAHYRAERLWATAANGTRIPISIAYRIDEGKRIQATHPRPLLLEAYGAYGAPSDAYFLPERVSLLDRGVIYALAHVRGGGEFGTRWHDGGRLLNKKNSFTDFIACAEYLQSHHYTTPGQTAIVGSSAGGLLVGAVLNQRPDLFRAAIARVPWVDALADSCDPSIPTTTTEYKEWGNPANPAEREYLRSYCPYTNVKAQRYPAILARESFNDSQVQYWDAARWVAKLRAMKTDPNSLLLRMDMAGSHHGASGRYASIHDAAFNDAWLLRQLSVAPPTNGND